MKRKSITFVAIAVLCVIVAITLARCANSTNKAVSHFPGIGAPMVTLIICVAVVFVLLAAGYWLVRYLSPQMLTAVEESTVERFRRLDGLFRSIPIEVRESSEHVSSAEEFRWQRAKLETLINSTELKNPQKSEIPDFVHNLHLIYLQITPAPLLCFEIDSLRKEYSYTVGSEVYQKYLSSPAHTIVTESKDPGAQIRLLRADAIFLANETRRLTLLKAHVEATRRRLVNSAFASWWANVVPMFAILLFYLFCQACADHAANVHTLTKGGNPPPPADWAAQFADAYLINENKLSVPISANADASTPIQQSAFFQTLIAGALLALAGIAGASGGMISVVQRVQSNGGSGDAGADLRTLSQAEGSVFFAPVTGAIFAVVLSAMLAGRFVSGTIFPDTQNVTAWYFILWSPAELAKWVLWGFLAGFSERMVPDMLNNLTQKVTDPNAGKPPEGAEEAAAAAVAVPPVEETDGEDGDQGDEELFVSRPHIDEDDGTNVVPELNSHGGTIPPEATEVTVTGNGFTARTDVYVNGRPKEKSAILEFTATSLRIRLKPEDLDGRTAVVVVASNPAPGGDKSHPLNIPIAPMGN